MKLAVAVAALLFVLISCGSPPKMTPEQIVAEMTKESGGRDKAVTAWPVTILRENGKVERKTLFVVTRPDGGKVLFDWTGQRYQADIEEFRADNHVLTQEDKFTVDGTFPNPRPADEHVQVKQFTGHTSTIWTWWLITGIAVVVVAAAGGIALRVRKRRRIAAYEAERVADQDGGEPTE